MCSEDFNSKSALTTGKIDKLTKAKFPSRTFVSDLSCLADAQRAQARGPQAGDSVWGRYSRRHGPQLFHLPEEIFPACMQLYNGSQVLLEN